MENKRLLNLEGGRNFRELGGYPTQDGQVIKTHKVIRSEPLVPLSEKDWQYLSASGIRFDFVFRQIHDQKPGPDREPPKPNSAFDPVYIVD